MADHHVLLPGAKVAVLVSPDSHPTHWVRNTAIALGVVAVLVGAADVVTRFSDTMLGSCGITSSFGPALSAVDPSVVASQGSGAPCR